MKILLNILVSGLAVFISAYILPGVHIANNNFITAILVAIVLGVLNAILKPILLLLTLPINIVTLGLFTLVVNAVIILLVTQIVPDFKVDGILWAIGFSLVLSIVNSILNIFTKD
jgi:putative membrane protein